MSGVWKTARAWAAMGLPGLPKAGRSLRRLAAREGWPRRRRAERGGGWEYPVSALPAAARAALAERAVTAPAPVIEEDAPARLILADAAALDDAARRVMAARLFVLGEVERLRRALCRASTFSDDGRRHRKDAQRRFAARAAIGDLPERTLRAIADANLRPRQAVGAAPISETTLRRWWREHEAHGETGVVPRSADQPNPDWLWPFMAFYRRPSKPSLRQAHEAFAAAYQGEVPPYSTLIRVVRRQPAAVKQQGRMGPREMKSIRAHTVRTVETLAPADVYTADGHCADFEVAHPFAAGQVLRPEIISVVDVKTRVCVGWAAGLDESSQLVTDALRAAAMRAIPAIFYVDRGAGFKNEHLQNAELGILGRLGTTREQSLPYNSQARGVGERFHRSVWNRAGRDLPTFVGADMDPEARKRVFQRSRAELAERGASSLHMAWERFIAWGHEVVAAYNARPHSGCRRSKMVRPASAGI